MMMMIAGAVANTTTFIGGNAMYKAVDSHRTL
jgi:hypothetical protein